MKIYKTELVQPLIDDDDLELAILPRISMNAMQQWYTLLETVGDGFSVYRGNVSRGFTSGKRLGDEFIPAVHVMCRDPSNLGANIPSQLDNWVQVVMVNVDTTGAFRTYTKSTYEIISKRFDLVSDRKGYWGAKKLWQFLARSHRYVHIYVWDGNTQDYVRDSDGIPHKYDGSNIPENVIWGETIEHAKRLLVATKIPLH